MEIGHDKAGNLLLTADCIEQDEIASLLKSASSEIAAEAIFVVEMLPDNFEQVQPEDVGALTGATIVSDGENVYGDMSYQVQSFLEELAAGGTVSFQKG